MTATRARRSRAYTTCSIGIWFGAHVALSTQMGARAAPPPFLARRTTSRSKRSDGESVGQRDNQMQTGAIINPFNLIIVKNTIGGDDTFDYAVTGEGLNDFSILTSGATGTHEFLDLTPGTDDRSM